MEIHSVDGAQPLRLLQFGYRISELGRTGHRCGRHSGAADRVDDIVVVQLAARGQLHGPRGRVDACGAVNHQLDALAEERAVVDGGVAGAGRELVQPESLDERRARVDQGDVDVGA